MARTIIFYLMNDQPMICPFCDARTDIIAGFYHTISLLFVHECLNNECKHVFFEVEK